MLSHLRSLYYLLKPWIPRHVQLALRRKLIRRQIGRHLHRWPVDEQAASVPEGWSGWPEGKRFSLVLTHDVDTQRGHDRCLLLAEMEESLGFRSSFNFVVDDYAVSAGLRRELTGRGFEVGVHGLTHDASLYRSRAEFQRQAVRINRILEQWQAVGFRSPAMYHQLEWLTLLDVDYDASTFDTDPFEPQPDGVKTIFPFSVPPGSGKSGYIELPYTLPQDFTLYILMQETDIGIWMRKLDWIVKHGGMALINVHPDYLNFSEPKGLEEYPAVYYHNFLEQILRKYKNQYWHVLPKDLAKFWKTRSEKQMES